MNVFGEKKRGWRKARKRGVSPIIATILLVAITVVLAAVLYVLISGLTTGPGNAPLGSHFGWGAPTNQTSLGTCTTGHEFCYSIDIASVSGVTTSSVSLGLHSASGATVAFPAAGVTMTVTLFSAQGANLATYSAGAWTVTAGSGFNGAFTAGMTVSITSTGSATVNGGMLGDSLVAIGGGSYSGTVVANAFP